MRPRTFDRETLLDLTVNFVPLGMLLFFLVLFALANPFAPAPVETAVQFAVLGASFVALAVLTYYAGRAVSRAERELESTDGADGEVGH